jgi:hypothetical protein
MYSKPIFFTSEDDVKKHIILQKTQESIIWDFKREINLADKKKLVNLASEIACDICQFANAWGGSILVGIEESKGKLSGLNVAKDFVGIDNCELVKQFLNDRVRNCIHPIDVQFETSTIKLKDKTLLAINVKALPNTLACVSSPANIEYLRFPYRTEYGKKYFRGLEIEVRMNNNYRRIFLRLNEIWDRNKDVVLLSPLIKEDIDPKLTWDNRDINITISDFFENEFQLKVNDLFMNIPYGLVRELWNTIDNKIGLILNASIVIPGNRKSLNLTV